MSKEYWRISAECALDEAGLSATSTQLDTIAKSLACSAEHEGTGTGRDDIPNPMESVVRETKAAAARDLKDKDRTIAEQDATIEDLRRRLYRALNELESARAA